MPLQHWTNFPNIAQERSQANIEQKDKIVRNNLYILCHRKQNVFRK